MGPSLAFACCFGILCGDVIGLQPEEVGDPPQPNYRLQFHQLVIDHQPAGVNAFDLLMAAGDAHRQIADEMAERDGSYVTYQACWEPDEPEERLEPAQEVERVRAQIERARAMGLLDTLAEIAAADNLVPPPPEGRLLDWEIPHMGIVRELARLNAARMALAAIDGDEAAFLAAMEQNLWIGRRTGSGGLIISRLLGIAVEALTLERIRDAIQAGFVRGDRAGRVLELIDAQHALPPFEVTLRSEQLLRRDALAFMYTDGGLISPERMRWDGEGEPPEPGPGLSSNQVATRDEMLERESEIESVIRAIAAARPQDRNRLSKQLDEDSPLFEGDSTFSILPVLIPSVARPADTDDQIALDLAGTRIMLAIEVYRAEHGLPPPELAAHTPGILEMVPTDPFVQGALVYRRWDDAPLGYVLYSSGFDRRDDGGTAPRSGSRHGALRPIGAGTDYLFVAED
jgi:hypothetical protein